jgi:hypothetical protein
VEYSIDPETGERRRVSEVGLSEFVNNLLESEDLVLAPGAGNPSSWQIRDVKRTKTSVVEEHRCIVVALQLPKEITNDAQAKAAQETQSENDIPAAVKNVLSALGPIVDQGARVELRGRGEGVPPARQ